MKRSHLFSTLCFCVFTFITTSSNAALVDRGGGLIYDSDQDLTWMQDAFYAGSLLSQETAMAWADDLVFGGVDDWRLPSTLNVDPSCETDNTARLNLSLTPCSGGELGHLYYDVGGYTPGIGTGSFGGTLGPFFEIYGAGYWTSESYLWTGQPYEDPAGTQATEEKPYPRIPKTNQGWLFYFGNGNKTYLAETANRAAWAVRDGDVGEPILPDDLSAKTQEGLVYVAVEPCRLVDTRESDGAIAAGRTRNFLVSGAVAGQGGNAAGCRAPKQGSEPLAITAYVVAVPTSDSGAGVLAAYPSDQPVPAAGTGSTVNFAAGEIVGNTTNIKLCDPRSCAVSGQFAILARATNQHVIVDVQGYYYSMEQTCPVDMVAVGSLCVDKYEAGVWNAAGNTQYGVSYDDHPCQDDGSDCGKGAAHPIYARSEAGATPSAFITWYQAAQACANAGKRLPTTQEWQMAASGTPSGTGVGCNFSGAKTASGTLEPCTSTAGTFDMVGNLSEWSAELTFLPGGSGTSDNAGAMALGEDFNNTGGGTPSTQSMFIMDGSGDAFDDGPNTSICVVGFRCVQF